MLNENWRVSIGRQMDRLVIQFFIMRRVGDRIEYLTAGTDGLPALNTAKPFEAVKPFVEFSDAFYHFGILEAFAEALSKDGVKTENDTRIKATLDAQRYHLEDLRQMLKLES